MLPPPPSPIVGAYGYNNYPLRLKQKTYLRLPLWLLCRFLTNVITSNTFRPGSLIVLTSRLISLITEWVTLTCLLVGHKAAEHDENKRSDRIARVNIVQHYTVLFNLKSLAFSQPSHECSEMILNLIVQFGYIKKVAFSARLLPLTTDAQNVMFYSYLAVLIYSLNIFSCTKLTLFSTNTSCIFASVFAP